MSRTQRVSRTRRVTPRRVLPERIGIAEAAEILSVNPRTIRRLIVEGQLPAYRIGHTRVIRLNLDDVLAMARPIQPGTTAC